MALATEERALLQASLERFVGGRCSLANRRAMLRGEAGFSRENWLGLAQMGVLALPFEAELGGLAGSLADVMVVGRVLAQGLSFDPYVPCIVIAGRLLAQTRSNRLRNEWLEALVSGGKLIGLAHFERGAHAFGEVQATRVQRDGGWLRLDGSKLLVPLARELDAFVVTARDASGSLHACLIPAGTAGVQIRSYRLVDGQLAGDVLLHGVAVSKEFELEFANLAGTLEEVFDYAHAVLAADSVACMSGLLRMTIDHCNTRKQFGQPIGRFQALKHRLVDCHTSLEQAEAMLELVTCRSSSKWAANVAAAKAFIDERAVRIGHEAIQMHGGMGLTDELAVSHYHKRVVANSILYGERAAQLDAFAAKSDFLISGTPSSALVFTELLSAQEEAFRHTVRGFLSEALTPELKKASRRLTCTFPEKGTVVEWQKRLNARGWLGPLLPKELGGTGWSAVERFLFEYECAIAGAPERSPMGFRYVGPVIARFGSQWQKEYFLPRLFASEHYWAQGFSEPGAGSDLAALKTTAVLDGDHYLVRGSKLWTTNAHCADWIFCLVRSAQTAKPQEGISFLLIDLRSPGIRVEPIELLAVDHEVNQVFFDDVRVPARNLVGEAGRGWEYAKFLLELERGGSVISGRARHELDAVKELAATRQADLGYDRCFVRALAALEIRLMALEMLEFRLARALQNATDPSVAGSIIKLLSSELQEEITEMGVQVAGLAGLEFARQRPIRDPEESGYPGSDLELVATPRYLNTRAFTIFAGSSEIQREIIAKHILEMRS